VYKLSVPKVTKRQEPYKMLHVKSETGAHNTQRTTEMQHDCIHNSATHFSACDNDVHGQVLINYFLFYSFISFILFQKYRYEKKLSEHCVLWAERPKRHLRLAHSKMQGNHQTQSNNQKRQ